MAERDIRTEYDRTHDKFYAFFAFIGMMGAIVFVVVTSYLVVGDFITLHGQTRSLDLMDFQSKLKFTFRYLNPSASWILFCVLNVIAKRVFGQKYKFAALDPMVQNRTEAKVAQANSILTNSLEQFIINALCQLALITYLNEEETLKVIPLLNMLFVVGRITFWLGYPKMRAFGIHTTLSVNSAATIYCLFRFATEQF